MFTSIVLTIHLHLTMVEEAWTWVHHLAIWGSVGESRISMTPKSQPWAWDLPWSGTAARLCRALAMHHA